jgi:hypothetical protein
MIFSTLCLLRFRRRCGAGFVSVCSSTTQLLQGGPSPIAPGAQAPLQDVDELRLRTGTALDDDLLTAVFNEITKEPVGKDAVGCACCEASVTLIALQESTLVQPSPTPAATPVQPSHGMPRSLPTAADGPRKPLPPSSWLLGRRSSQQGGLLSAWLCWDA